MHLAILQQQALGTDEADLGRRMTAFGQAAGLVEWAQHLRGDDAAYWTGANYDDGTRYPEEQPTWTSAAVVLAADALAGGPTADLLRAGQAGAPGSGAAQDPERPLSADLFEVT